MFIKETAERYFEGFLNREIIVSGIRGKKQGDADNVLGYIDFYFQRGKALTIDANGDYIVPKNVTATCREKIDGVRVTMDAGGWLWTAKVKVNDKGNMYLVMPGRYGTNRETGEKKWYEKLWFHNQFNNSFNNDDVAAGLLAIYKWNVGFNFRPDPDWRIDRFKDVCKGPDMGCANSIYIGMDDESSLWDNAVGTDSIMQVNKRTRPCIVCALTGKYVDAEACDIYHDAIKHDISTIERQTVYVSAAGYVSDSVSARGKAVIDTMDGKRAFTLNQFRFRQLSIEADGCPYYRYNRKDKSGDWVSERPSAEKVMPWSWIKTATYGIDGGIINPNRLLSEHERWESDILPYEMTLDNTKIIPYPRDGVAIVRYAVPGKFSVTVSGPFRIVAENVIVRPPFPAVIEAAKVKQAGINAKIEAIIADRNAKIDSQANVTPQATSEEVSAMMIQLSTVFDGIIANYQAMPEETAEDKSIKVATKERIDSQIIGAGEAFSQVTPEAQAAYMSVITKWADVTITK